MTTITLVVFALFVGCFCTTVVVLQGWPLWVAFVGTYGILIILCLALLTERQR